jgi:predicted nucleotidyltransferase
MNRATVIDILRQHQAEFSALGVAHLSLFGSFARDEADTSSDLDVIVDSPDGEAFGFFALSRVMDKLEALFSRRADVISRAGLNNAERFRNRIEKEILNVF